METLKEKLFMLLAGSLDVLEFEQWLYSNAELIAQIDNDPLVFDVFALNYKDKDFMKLVEILCLQFDSPAAQLVATIERNCRKLLTLSQKSEILEVVYTLSHLHDWEEPFSLTIEFYSLEENYSLFVSGYNKGFDYIYETKKLAKSVINELKDKSIKEKVGFLIDGFPKNEKPIIV